MVEYPTVSPNLTDAQVKDEFGPRIEFGRSLAEFTSYATGGDARYFISCHQAEEASLALATARRLKVPHFVMGGGSNLLVSDRGYDGLVIKVDIQGIRLSNGHQVKVGAGVQLMDLVDFATEHELTGMEFAAGIWGAVGGAIYGNAGAYGGDMGSVVTSVRIIDEDLTIRDVDGEYCGFAYRDSNLKRTRELVVSAIIALAPGEKKNIQQRVDEIIVQRAERHPVNGHSAGCFFKNIPDPREKHGKLPAGRLLEEVGAKEMSVGGASVYSKHANIIVNTGSATSADIRQLADQLKEKVRDRFGIELQEEVQQLGEF